jgi:hypothetical protein
MATMSESTSDALFGVDGTQSPEPLPDPPTGLGGGTWRGAPELPSMYLPPVLDDNALREAIAAAFAEDPTEPVDQDLAAAPVESGESSAPQPGGLPAPSVGPASQATGQPPASAESRSSPLIPPLFPSAPSRPRRPVGQRYRPPMAAAFRKPVPPADLYRRVGPDRPSVPRSSPGNLALGAGLFVAFIIAAVLVYNIIIGFLESISRLVP